MYQLNRWVIAAFGLMTGCYKMLGGAADVELFARLGLSAPQVALFGLVQAAAAVAVLVPSRRRAGGLVLAVCNAVGTYGLWNAGVQPFAALSLMFVAMAVVVAWRPGPAAATAVTTP